MNDKLIHAKEQWARDGRALTGKHGGDRLPPGQRLVTDWPVLDLGITPRVSTRDWTLSVAGAVESPARWTWDEFMALPQVELTSDIHCVTTWSRYDNLWRGVAVRTLLEAVRPKPTARFVMLKSHDGYSTNLPFDDFAVEDALLAHSWQGEPLSPEHGGPVRMVIPRLYFWKSAKWLRAITFMEQDSPGYWELRGYHDVGDPWKEERYR